MGSVACVVLALANLIFLLGLDWRFNNCFYHVVYSVKDPLVRTVALGAVTLALAGIAIAAFRIQRRLALSKRGTAEAKRSMFLTRMMSGVFLVMLVTIFAITVGADC